MAGRGPNPPGLDSLARDLRAYDDALRILWDENISRFAIFRVSRGKLHRVLTVQGPRKEYVRPDRRVLEAIYAGDLWRLERETGSRRGVEDAFDEAEAAPKRRQRAAFRDYIGEVTKYYHRGLVKEWNDEPGMPMFREKTPTVYSMPAASPQPVVT